MKWGGDMRGSRGFSIKTWLPRALIPNEHGKKVRVLRDSVSTVKMQDAYVVRDSATGLHSLVGPMPRSEPIPITQVLGWSPA